MQTRLTVLVDNIAKDGIKGEWGLSILVEHRVGKEIRETGIDYVCTGHCIKDRAYNILKEELGDRLE